MAAAEHSLPSHAHTRTHLSPAVVAKEKKAEYLARAMLSHKVVSLVGFRGVPASNLQSMRRDLAAKKYFFKVAPNTQILHAITAASKERKGLAELAGLVSDQTAILLADSNPFALHRELLKTKSKVAPRGGEIAPEDIRVFAGETSFKPGPIVGELQHAGFPAAIEKGKVVIKKDTVIVKKGHLINREVAQMLSRLDIKPLEVGLMIRGAFDEGTLYQGASLAIDLDAIVNRMVQAQAQALGLAVAIGYSTPQTIERLLTKAKRQAMAIAMERGFISHETVALLLGKAVRQANAVKGLTS